ncbi:MAG: hypothetical protein WCP07_04185 [bacterium]|jgi:hypothetical protein
MQKRDGQTVQQTWKAAAERAKRDYNSLTFYRAIDAAVPVAWEDSDFVIGMPPVEGQISAAINTRDYQLAIERALREKSGDDSLRLRVVEGITYADWEYAKQRNAASIANVQQSVQRQASTTAAFVSWEEVYERVSRLWAATENRSLAIGRARYMTSALKVVEEAVERLYPADGEKPDELNERGLSRVLERVGSYTNTDPAILAYLLLQRRE